MIHSLFATGCMLWNTRNKFSTILLVLYTILTLSFYLGLWLCKINYLKNCMKSCIFIKYIFYVYILVSIASFNMFGLFVSKFLSMKEKRAI